MQPCAAPCRSLQGRRRKYALLLASGSFWQSEGRGFDPPQLHQFFPKASQAVAAPFWNDADRDGDLRRRVVRIRRYDRDGKRRIATGTLDSGQATIQHYDRDGKKRISAGTVPKGNAGISINSSTGGIVWNELSK